jgi:3-oxosteroid 1-dehydrogenase
MTAAPIAARESAAPVRLDGFDVEADVVVVGGGGAGLPVALFSRWRDNEVVLLEKAPELGGTARKAAFWYWVPNNEPMRELGIEDSEAGFLRYVAKVSAPDRYDTGSPTLGLDPWEYQSFRAIYESASPAAEQLREKGALVYRHVAEACDYWSELPEDEAPVGRVLIHEDAGESMADGGLHSIESMAAAARRDGVDIRLSHRVQRLAIEDGRVIGVEATTPTGETVRLRARKGVVFATGGFTHDAEMRRGFLGRPAFGGCAAVTNEGDLVRIAPAAGAQLRAMSSAWMCPIPLEKAIAGDPTLSGMFSVSGDSMIFVNRHGRRAANEKLQYNELAQRFFQWDGDAQEFPNLVMIQIWDRRSQEHSAGTDFGRLIPPPGADDSHVIVGQTLAELGEGIAERLRRHEARTGGLSLSEDFGANLKHTVKRFNGFAEAGVDEDFGRGELPVQLMFNGPVAEEGAEKKNPTMHPIDDSGPYYAALVVGGTLDTKGGPKTDTEGRMLDDSELPIEGLYGVGNCVASASGNSYWAGGATLGPIMAFAYRTAAAIDGERHSAEVGSAASVGGEAA